MIFAPRSPAPPHRPKANGSAASSIQTRKLTTVQRTAMKTILGCYRTTPTVAMEIESGLPPPWIRLQTKVLSSLTRMQSLAPHHPIHQFISNGLRTRTAAIKHRSCIENALQQFPVTTTGRLNGIAPFTQPPWCNKTDEGQLYQEMEQKNHKALTEKYARIKEIKDASTEQWTHMWKSDKRPLGLHLKQIITRNGNQHGPALYNRILNRNTCAKTIQLRTGHCGLNKYLHRFGIIDSASCECGSGQETVEHFLLECPLYRVQRSVLRNKVGGGRMRVDELLGDWKTIVEHTMEFIKNTGRLD